MQVLKQQKSRPKQLQAFNRFQVPPNFTLAYLHARSCKLYKNNKGEKQLQRQQLVCPCCQRSQGLERISICQDIESIDGIGQQVPLFFTFNSMIISLVLGIIFIKAGEFLFFCNTQNKTCAILQYEFTDIPGYDITIPLGFWNDNDLSLMIEIILYFVIILGIKLILKTKKYKSRTIFQGIEKRSVKLVNVSKKATKNQLLQMFEGFFVEDITFAYKVEEYHEAMTSMYKREKKLLALNNKIKQKNKKKSKQKINPKGKPVKNQYQQISQQFANEVNHLQSMNQSLVENKNRTSIAFVVLNSKHQRALVLQKFECNFLSKLFFKLMPCCSKSSIHNQHITVTQATAPDNIFWQNVQNPYITTKLIRLSSFIVCLTLLIFGIVSEILVINKPDYQISGNQLITAVIIFCINFIIINFLEYTTHNIQKHMTVTSIKLSLIRKITFFMFINIGIAPYLLFMYAVFYSELKQKYQLTMVGFQVLIISLSNCFKPFLTLFSVERFIKWAKSLWEKSKGEDSELNQMEANNLLEPLEFPIEIYYSLVHTSLMMMFLYLSFYQVILLVELPAMILLFFIAKWMLVKVCKKPSGLSLKLNNLAQSLMRLYLVLYWLGTKITLYIITKQDGNFFDYLFLRNTYCIISFCFAIAIIFSQPLVKVLGKRIYKVSLDEINDPLLLPRKGQRTYKQANIGFRVNGESYTEMKKRIKSLNLQIYRQSQTCINLK